MSFKERNCADNNDERHHYRPELKSEVSPFYVALNDGCFYSLPMTHLLFRKCQAPFTHCKNAFRTTRQDTLIVL